jgi:CheY-like chemotaxis protein
MRQPLHALMLYVSALEKRVQTADARDILAKMDRATRSMAGMFATLLDLARIQSGVFEPEITDFPLQEVIDRIIAESPEGALDAPTTHLSIHSDPSLIERVLRNLVGNAIKHGGGKARIEVAARGNEVEIAVADDGPGIAAEDQKRIFEEFVRLEGRGDGLGLGLTIVKHIADLLDMPITLQSTLGHGARFSMRMPLAHAAAAPAEHSAAANNLLAGVPTLVVDDDPLAREAVSGVLRDLGAQVRACANEAEAQAALADFTPSLMVTDFRIEGQLCGLDVARRLHAKLATPPATIVITGDTEQETLAALTASGFAWLIKPVDPRILIETAAAQLRADAVSAT